jgi:hypothetical protein
MEAVMRIETDCSTIWRWEEAARRIQLRKPSRYWEYAPP